MADRDTSRQCSRLLRVLPAVLAFMLVSGIETVAGTERSISASLPGGLLSTPLPGTRAREDTELTARLEQALVGFDGVADATVIVTRASDLDASSSPDVAIQVTLSDGFVATPAWLGAVRIFSLRTIPHLDEDALTIVDSTGRVLLDAGEMHVVAHLGPPPDIGVVDETFRFEPWWLWTAAGVGFVLVVAGVSTQFFLRREPEAVALESKAGPLDFLEAISDEQLAEVLAGERAEVMSAVSALAPEALAARLARLDGLRINPAVTRRSPDPVMAAALARALSEKLVRV